MADIGKVNGVVTASIGKIHGIAKASIGKFMGQVMPSGGGADYVVSGGDIADAMGDYNYAGKDPGLGYDYYSNANSYYMYYDSSAWMIGTQLMGPPMTWKYGGPTGTYPDPTGTYTGFDDPGDEATCVAG